jgi:multidrug resistance efflux pump
MADESNLPLSPDALESTAPTPTRTYAELDALYNEAVAYVRHVEADFQHTQAHLKHVETIYADMVVYTNQLEQSVVDHKQAAAETAGYVIRLEAELAALHKAQDEGRTYAESLLAHIRRLEVKLHDMEENLRQYQQG